MNSENELDHEYQPCYNDPNAKKHRDELLEETHPTQRWEDLPCDDDEVED
jgi:hypothetical protein